MYSFKFIHRYNKAVLNIIEINYKKANAELISLVKEKLDWDFSSGIPIPIGNEKQGDGQSAILS